MSKFDSGPDLKPTSSFVSPNSSTTPVNCSIDPVGGAALASPPPPTLRRVNYLGNTFATNGNRIYSVVARKKKGDCRTDRKTEDLKELCNFYAEILSEKRIHDSSGEMRIVYLVRIATATEVFEGEITALEFAGADWWTKLLGVAGVIAVGFAIRELIRNAVLAFSKPERVVAHERIGWLEVDGVWWYLHAGGAICATPNTAQAPALPNSGVLNPLIYGVSTPSGAGGAVCAVPQAHLPEELQTYSLPIPDRKELQTSGDWQLPLQLIKWMPHEVITVLLAVVFRSVLGPSETTVFVAGRTGTRKTSLVLMFLQFFGAGFSRQRIPAGWHDTVTALEAKASTIVDAPLMVDDFAPTGSSGDVSALHQKAERFIREKSNAKGRSRGTSTGGLRNDRRPLATLVCTGEDIPAGESLQARLFPVDVTAGSIDLMNLRYFQVRGEAGDYARIMACFVEWLAGIRQTNPDLAARWRWRVHEFRETLPDSLHGRVAEMAADLLAGLCAYFDFVKECFDKDFDVDEHLTIAWRHILNLVDQHQETLATADPVVRFIVLLRHGLSLSRFHLRLRYGNSPLQPEQIPELFGYARRVETIALPVRPRTDLENGPEALQHHPTLPDETGDQSSAKYIQDAFDPGREEAERDKRFEEVDRYRPGGNHVGWLDGRTLLLSPDMVYAEVQKLAKSSGPPLPLSVQQLGKQLADRGILMVDRKGRLRSRTQINGERLMLWKLDFELFTKAQVGHDIDDFEA
jgi:hypothetical protein